MLIDNVMFYFLIGAGIILSLPALWLLMLARWPRRVEKLRTVSGRSMLVSFLAGIVPVLVIVGLLTALGKLGQKGEIVPAVTVAVFSAVFFVWCLAGLAGLVTVTGEKISAPNVEPWRAMLRGGVVMVCLLSMPFLGWFALLPVCVITGGGMMVRSFFLASGASLPQKAPPIPVGEVAPSA